ncbi:MAG: TolC family protein [Pyrinomonadaceae bacterium]|nr:TolC family protein [Pyrinomonadaceae bacterium]
MRKAYSPGALALVLLFCLLFQIPVRGQQPSATQSAPAPATTRQQKQQRLQRPPAETGRQDVPPARPRATNAPPPYYDYPFGSLTDKYQVISVDDAVSLALANASLYQQAFLDEQIAREDVRQARAAFFPQINLPLTYTGTTPSKLRNPGDPLVFSFVSASAINETTALLNVSGTIDLAGRLRAALSRSRALLEAANAGTRVARRELVLATVDAYYALALTRQRRRLADETLALAEGFVSVAEALKARGEGEEADVSRARTAAATQRDALEQARSAEFAAMNLLKTLTGIDFSTQILTAHLTENVPSVSDFNSYTEDIIRSRPELAQLDAQAKAARAEARAARRELLPDLTYSLNGGFDAGDFRPVGRYSGGSAIISLNVPVFNFGASRSRERQARLRSEQLDIQRELLLRQLRQEFYINRANALGALERIRDMRVASDAAQQNMTSVFMRYRMRKATILDVVDAQSSFAETRSAYYQAIVDYHTSRIRLEEDPARPAFTRAVAGTEPQAGGATRAASAGICPLTLQQAPNIGGLYLGMTLAQANALFPSLKQSPPDKVGVTNAILNRNDLARNQFFDGVQTILLQFVEDRLYFIHVGYPVTNKWNSKDEFVTAVAQKLNVNGDWKPFYDWQDKNVRDLSDLRSVGIECKGFRLSAGIGIEGLGGDQFPRFDLEDMNTSRTIRERAEDLRRKEQEKP